MSANIIAARRQSVIQAYNSAQAENYLLFLEGDEKATSEYIYDNQKKDAIEIVLEFEKNDRRVISITKKTKVGMDGLMIEVAKLMTTHPDDSFVVDPAKVRIITGMSNAGWEKDMKDKAPNCFKDKIFHHGQLPKSDLNNLQNALIIIDEIDTGDKAGQVLHSTLKEAGVLDAKHMVKNNNRFIFASATMIKELYDLYRWGDLHKWHKMSIPDNYIGHIEFLQKEIIKEFYPLDTEETAEKWIQEDIIDNYGEDFRVHIVRLTTNGKLKNSTILQNACIRKGVVFRNHTSTDKMTPEETRELFKESLKSHIVLGVKGFFRRANLIPNKWKLRIGATHELCTKGIDYNVQIQGLPGRMTGYWRDVIESGHKTGPHRTSIKAIEDYENVFNNPFGLNSYQTSGFKKKNGRVNAKPTMISPQYISGLVAIDLPTISDDSIDINSYRIYSDEKIVKKVCKILGYKYLSASENSDGFKETSLNNLTCVASLKDAIKKVRTAYGGNKGENTAYRTCYPCYVDTTNKETLRFVVIIRPGTDAEKIQEADLMYESIPYNAAI
jgi:hypothetical protein